MSVGERERLLRGSAAGSGRAMLSRRGDARERQADRIAHSGRKSRDRDAAAPRPSATPSVSGQAMSERTRAALRDRFEDNLLAGIRIYSDDRAQRQADLLGARAFSCGEEIWLGRGESAGDVELMAHEAAHVLQTRIDGGPPVLARQEVPPSLKTKVDLSTMSDDQLHKRYDLIVSTLAQLKPATGTGAPDAGAGANPDAGVRDAGAGDGGTAKSGDGDIDALRAEAGRIGVELTARALKSKRTFSPAAIQAAQAYFVANAAK